MMVVTNSFFPALLLSCVTLAAIVGMGLGRYYKQTHVHTLAKLKQTPTVEHLNQDEQILVRESILHVALSLSLLKLCTCR